MGSAKGWRRIAAAAFLAFAGVVPRASAEEPACLEPAAIADADVAAFATELADPALCLGERRFSENGIDWHLVVIRNTVLPGPLWFVPHDEEDEGFAAAVTAVLRHGGVVVAVENGEARLAGGQDPNLAFAITAEAAATCPGARATAPAYVAAVLDEWDRTSPIIGLHSNWDGFAAGGGLGTISVRRADAKMIPFPSALATGRLADEDTIVMIPGASPPAEPAAAAAIGWFNERGVHVIYRLISAANNECTIADYLTLAGLGPYVNIEVEHGDFATLPALVEIVMAFFARDAGT